MQLPTPVEHRPIIHDFSLNLPEDPVSDDIAWGLGLELGNGSETSFVAVISVS